MSPAEERDMWRQSCEQARAAFDELTRQFVALRAERAELVESIAAGFDTAAKDAAVHNKGPDRDIDVVLAWECAARRIREHAANRPTAAAAAVSSPTGTPLAPDPRDAVVDRAVEWHRRRSDRHATGMEFHAACRALADAVDALPATSPKETRPRERPAAEPR